MFFLIKDLAALNHMYRFSLTAFMHLFKQALSQVRIVSLWILLPLMLT
jgi:hypothetical protein